MISGWLVKIVVGIALIGFAVIELGSPLVAKAQVDDSAHQVADAAALALGNRDTQETLETACKDESERESVALVACNVNSKGEVAVTVSIEARSFLLNRFSATKDWYHVEASATADRK